LSYNGYLGTIEYNKEENSYSGIILGPKDDISYQGKTINELEQAFNEAVNNLINTKPQRDGWFLLTKLNVAERQLVEAVKLFFEKRDPVSIHTLTGAAIGILEPILEHKKVNIYNQPLVFHPEIIKIWAKPEYEDVFLYSFRKHQNFFKHADKEPEGKIEFNLALNNLKLLYGIMLHDIIADYYLYEFFIYKIWFQIKHPNLFIDKGESVQNILKESGVSPSFFEDFELLREAMDINNPSFFSSWSHEKPIKRFVVI